jgi:hypothetical protein
MFLATVVIAVVAGINAFVVPAVPEPEPDVVEPTPIPYTPPVILPTATIQPTLTPLPPTPGPTTRPTRAPATAAAQPTAAAQQPTAPPAEQPTAEPTPNTGLIYVAPPLNTPPNNDSIGAQFIRFRWGKSQFDTPDVPANLPPDQWYRIKISYTDRSSNLPVDLVKCTHESSMDTRTGIDVSDRRGNAVDSTFLWNVIIIRAESQQECETGGGAPLSPPSATFKFLLP